LIDSYFDSNIQDGKLGGVITLIAEKGKIKHFKAYGYSDIENSIKMEKDILIPIASLTKVITSIAILQLHEQGKIIIDDPIEKYITCFKDLKHYKQPDSSNAEDLPALPTIRDFLRHTSGMVYSIGNSRTDELYKDAGFRDWDKSLECFVQKVAEIPLAFAPNQNWSYSYSYDVLGYLVEKITEISFNDYCMKYIFHPLGLNNIDFFVRKSNLTKLSKLYQYDGTKLVIDDDKNSFKYNSLPNTISASGGWWSSYGGIIASIEDFYIITEMLLNYGSYNGTQILSENSVKSMISNQIGSLDAFGNKYGFGVGVITSKKNIDVTEEIFWAGSPYNTYFWINYKENVVGILFTNTAPFGHLGMMEKFKDLTENGAQK